MILITKPSLQLQPCGNPYRPSRQASAVLILAVQMIRFKEEKNWIKATQKVVGPEPLPCAQCGPTLPQFLCVPERGMRWLLAGDLRREPCKIAPPSIQLWALQGLGRPWQFHDRSPGRVKCASLCRHCCPTLHLYWRDFCLQLFLHLLSI